MTSYLRFNSAGSAAVMTGCTTEEPTIENIGTDHRLHTCSQPIYYIQLRTYILLLRCCLCMNDDINHETSRLSWSSFPARLQRQGRKKPEKFKSSSSECIPTIEYSLIFVPPSCTHMYDIYAGVTLLLYKQLGCLDVVDGAITSGKVESWFSHHILEDTCTTAAVVIQLSCNTRVNLLDYCMYVRSQYTAVIRAVSTAAAVS